MVRSPPTRIKYAARLFKNIVMVTTRFSLEDVDERLVYEFLSAKIIY